jgi:sulfate transport system substrate-binding protein
MYFNNSRLAVSIFISLVSLGAAYPMLHTISHSSTHDPAGEMYADLNDAFANHWKARTGRDVSVRQAQSKSGKPIRVVFDGLDVATLALSYGDTRLDEKNGFITPPWNKLLQNTLPASSYASPYTTTIVFLVRKGNPKGLKDWDDLLRSGIEVVVPNPEISGEGRWSYLAAWGYALRRLGGSEEAALEFVRKLFANVKLRNFGPQKAATTDFIERGIGDVLLAWENEAHLLAEASSRGEAGRLEIITPSISIVAEPVISVVDAVAPRGTEHPVRAGHDMVAAYIDYLYTPQAQDIAGKHYYRPRDAHIGATYATRFPPLELFTVDEVFGGWKKAQEIHFAKGGVFEQIQSN